MKKLLILSFTLCFVLSPITSFAQKKGTTKGKQPIKTEQIKLVTEADTISYAFGAMIVQQGLKGYLSQMGVLADTASYEDVRLDSVKAANKKNMAQFISGFHAAMNQGNEDSAYNTGMAIGTQLSSGMGNMSKEVLGKEGLFNKEAFIAAFSSALNDEKLLIDNTENNVQNASTKAQSRREEEAANSLKDQYADRIADEARFMEQNKTKQGVVTLPSGLQYEVIQMGTGDIPTATDRVKVHYHGTLIDGTVFDSSVDRGEPIDLGVNQVIKGWTEALQLMPVGSKWKLYVPYDLAYGSRDQGTIKPFSNLIFEVELIDIDK